MKTSYFFLISIFLTLFISPKINGDSFQTLDKGPIHEAYMHQEFGNIILLSVPKIPPREVNEQIPKQNDTHMIWVPGYWHWDIAAGDFIWVSGIWRQPPPGHIWIPGYWKHYRDGWVWINGFWNDNSALDLYYLEFPPPEKKEEVSIVDKPREQGYFWMQGHWHFDQTSEKYVWFRGQWQPLDPNWIYVPAHYIWRPGGYVFVRGYWDWPLHNRGIVYKPIVIEPDERDRIIYVPEIVWEPIYILESYFVYYPTYQSVYYHHYYFHTDYWINCNCTPPWWSWGGEWWSFTWDNHWALWWWYTHPGYPAPSWLTTEYTKQMASPTPELMEIFKTEKVTPPAIVTPNGVAKPSKLIKAINEREGVEEKLIGAPILPAEPEEIENIQRSAIPKVNQQLESIRPTGKDIPKDLIKKPPSKPQIDKEVEENSTTKGSNDVERIRVPKKPKSTEPSLPQFQNDQLLQQQLQEESETFREREPDRALNEELQAIKNRKDSSIKPIEPKESFPQSNNIESQLPSNEFSEPSSAIQNNNTNRPIQYPPIQNQEKPAEEGPQDQNQSSIVDPTEDPRLVIPQDITPKSKENSSSDQPIDVQPDAFINQKQMTVEPPQSQNIQPRSSSEYMPNYPIPPNPAPKKPSMTELQPRHPLQNVTPSAKKPAHERNSAPNSGSGYQPSQPKASPSAPSSSGPGQHARIIIPKDNTSSATQSSTSPSAILSNTQGTAETPPQTEVDRTPPKPLPPPPISEYPIRKEYALPQAQQDLGRLMNSSQPPQNYEPSVHDSRGFRESTNSY